MMTFRDFLTVIPDRLTLDGTRASTQEQTDKPDTVTTGACKQSEFSLARLAPKELQHLLRVGAAEPFLFGHVNISRFTQAQVNGPATTYMRARSTKMAENACVRTSRLL
jgi:hypothetical protein